MQALFLDKSKKHYSAARAPSELWTLSPKYGSFEAGEHYYIEGNRTNYAQSDHERGDKSSI